MVDETTGHSVKGANALRLFAAALRRSGHRLTSQRQEILTHVLGTQGHFDAEQLNESIRRRGIKVSRATVYRTLEYIERCNLVSRVDVGNGRRLFERAPDSRKHEHMHCIRCGKTVEFHDPVLKERVIRISRMSNFSTKTHGLQVLGVCRECEQAEALAHAMD